MMEDISEENLDDIDAGVENSDESKKNTSVVEKDTPCANTKSDQVMVVTTEQDWDRLVHTAGLVLVDVYSGWCGPCSSMEAHLKRLRVASIMAEDRVSLARACCDNIEELAPFRKDPRPTWLFLSSGIPTALLRGANRPLLTKLFHNELALEREGRMPVYIDYKSQSAIQCVGPLSELAQDETVQSIGSGRTEMLSELFEEKATLETPVPNVTVEAAKDRSGDTEDSSLKDDNDEATEREIVDILLAADLASAEDEGDYEDDYEDKIYSGDINNPNLITKPKKRLELKAGLLREILSNKPKRHTFSGLYL